MRFAVDTGGTFTDLVVESDSGEFSLYKSPTTPDDPIRGVLDVLEVAATDRGVARTQLLAGGTTFIHATTRAINAVLTGNTARTAFLTTEGHPDVLLFREGGRTEPFNFTRPYPDPYIPRALTFEVTERVGAAGEVVLALDEGRVEEICAELREREVEAVAVCFLWSILNPAHEERVGQLLETHLPGLPFTLSHRLNPAIREYRRASSTAIDASLKPTMSAYLRNLDDRLAEAGFGGRVLVVTSAGGVLDARTVAETPIHTIGSGPAMAPVAGRYYAGLEAEADTAIVADTGGTSYDVSLVRRGRIPWTRETWLGAPYFGHMTGFPSVDVKSIGAGGGSIAWVDEGGLLHVGPESAGSVPGPACYGRGGTKATVTDACLVLGYLDPDFFLGGVMQLDAAAAVDAVERDVASGLGLGVHEAAAAVLQLASEHMIRAIEEITLNQGIDPRSAVLVGGGGAAGFNVVTIARRLGCPLVVMPAVGAVLSAAGALMSDLTSEYAGTLWTASGAFDFERVNALLADLQARCLKFAEGPGAGSLETTVEFSAEARYPHQIWELDVQLRGSEFDSTEDVEMLRQDFHRVHREVFAIADPESPIEIVAWRARVHCRIREEGAAVATAAGEAARQAAERRAFFPGLGLVDARVLAFEGMEVGRAHAGPAIVESPVSTVVIDADASVRRTGSGNLLIVPSAGAADAAPVAVERGAA